MLKTFFAAAALSIASLGMANSATVTPIASSVQNGAGNQAHLFAPTYTSYLNGGASWDKDPTWTPPPVSNSIAKSPFVDTPLAGTQKFYSVGPAAQGDNGAISPATLTFGKTQSAFRMLWGSIDSYNTLDFLLDNTVVATFTGTAIANAISVTGTPNFEHVALLYFGDFSDDGFNKVRFTSTSQAFEFALAPVPLPAGGLLLIGALGGLAVLRRRKARAA